MVAETSHAKGEQNRVVDAREVANTEPTIRGTVEMPQTFDDLSTVR